MIDVQSEYFTGGLISVYPNPAMVLDNIGLAMDAARAAGVPVLVVRHTAPDGAPIVQKGQPEWDLHDEVKARPYDRLMEKTRDSVFAETDFAACSTEDWIAAIQHGLPSPKSSVPASAFAAAAVA